MIVKGLSDVCIFVLVAIRAQYLLICVENRSKTNNLLPSSGDSGTRATEVIAFLISILQTLIFYVITTLTWTHQKKPGCVYIVQTNLGFRTSLSSNNSVFERKI